MEETRLYTVPELARLLQQPENRVRHAIKVYQIAEHRRAGAVRLFSEHQLAEIRGAVRRVEERTR